MIQDIFKKQHTLQSNLMILPYKKTNLDIIYKSKENAVSISTSCPNETITGFKNILNIF